MIVGNRNDIIYNIIIRNIEVITECTVQTTQYEIGIVSEYFQSNINYAQYDFLLKSAL